MWFECESEMDEKSNKAPENRFIMHAPPILLPVIKRRFPDAKHYVENWMLVKKGQANSFQSEFGRRLRSEDDTSKFSMLLSTQKAVLEE